MEDVDSSRASASAATGSSVAIGSLPTSSTPTPTSSGDKVRISDSVIQTAEQNPNCREEPEENERRARVEEVWKKMNSGLPVKTPKALTSTPISAEHKEQSTLPPEWMVSLGLAPKKISASQESAGKRPLSVQNGTSEEAKRLAAAALSAVKDGTSSAVAARRGKVEITEIRNFTGEEIELKKLVDADSKEASEKAKVPGASPSALDTILEQIKKKPKLSVLDKTKKDWGEFKDENKGLEDELDAYKKSSNQYLDKVSFLQRADLREFEHERDARLALQSKRKPDMQEDLQN